MSIAIIAALAGLALGYGLGRHDGQGQAARRSVDVPLSSGFQSWEGPEFRPILVHEFRKDHDTFAVVEAQDGRVFTVADGFMVSLEAGLGGAGMARIARFDRGRRYLSMGRRFARIVGEARSS